MMPKPPFTAAEDALDALTLAILGPFDVEGAARDLAPEVRNQRRTIASLLSEVDRLLPWTRAPRRNRPAPRKIPRKQRPAALLVAVAASITAEDVEEGVDRVTWVMEQAAREHFAGQGGARADRTEVLFEASAIDRASFPMARDGHARARQLQAEPDQRKQAGPGACTELEDVRALLAGDSEAVRPDQRKQAGTGACTELDGVRVLLAGDTEAIRPAKDPEAKRQRQHAIAEFLATRAPAPLARSSPPSEPDKRKRARGVEPTVNLPEDPEAIYQREEEIVKFRATLSLLERKVMDHYYGETTGGGLEDVARSLGTTWKTVKTTRQRCRDKARAWLDQLSSEASNVTNPQRVLAARRECETRCANMKKPWGVDRDLLGLVRPMTPAELADWKAGYPVTRFRRRAAVWGRSPDRRGEATDTETVVRKAA